MLGFYWPDGEGELSESAAVALLFFAVAASAAPVAYAWYLLWSGRREHKADLDRASADFVTILHNMRPPN